MQTLGKLFILRAEIASTVFASTSNGYPEKPVILLAINQN
jgi:hypothetical protein